MASTTLEEPVFKKARSTDYVVSMIHPEGVHIIEDIDVDVFCISQTMRNIGDPAVGNRICLVANSNSESDKPVKIKETLLDDYILWHYNHMLVICFEAYKVLDQGFSEVLKAYGGLNQHQNFVRKFRKFAEKGAVRQRVPIPEGLTWVKSIPFGVFAEAICILYDCHANCESEVEKLRVLKEDAEGLFSDVMLEGIENLEEESASLEVDFVDFEALKLSPILNLVREWAHSARNRKHRNSLGHPFGPTTPRSLRKAALQSYNKCLEHEITKDCRNVALLGRVKLEINEKKIDLSASTNTRNVKASDFLISSDDEF